MQKETKDSDIHCRETQRKKRLIESRARDQGLSTSEYLSMLMDLDLAQKPSKMDMSNLDSEMAALVSAYFGIASFQAIKETQLILTSVTKQLAILGSAVSKVPHEEFQARFETIDKQLVKDEKTIEGELRESDELIQVLTKRLGVKKWKVDLMKERVFLPDWKGNEVLR